MFYYMPPAWNGLLFLADSRLRSDREIEENEGGVPVLEKYAMGIASLGKGEWARTARYAMFNHLERPPEDKKAAKAWREERKQALRAFLREHKPRAVIVLQTLSQSIEASNLTGTYCWDCVGGPGNLVEAQGTAWTGPEDAYYVPILNSLQYDEVTGWYIRRWIRAALDLARGALKPRLCPEKVIFPTERAVELLRGYGSQYDLSVDLETIPSRDTITAFNLSDGRTAVSLPWDEYDIYPHGVQPALATYPLGPLCKRLILDLMRNPGIGKYGHNMAGFDVLELARLGIECSGPIDDTLLMHRAVHPQHRHGLQIACATEFLTIPWKTMHKPVAKPKDSPEFWRADPVALRDYGADDAWATAVLKGILERKLG
jgi:hypothetical protein